MADEPSMLCASLDWASLNVSAISDGWSLPPLPSAGGNSATSSSLLAARAARTLRREVVPGKLRTFKSSYRDSEEPIALSQIGPVDS